MGKYGFLTDHTHSTYLYRYTICKLGWARQVFMCGIATMQAEQKIGFLGMERLTETQLGQKTSINYITTIL